MDATVLGNQQASPIYWAKHGAKGEIIAWVPDGGMTKREAIMLAVLSGFAANPDGATIAAQVQAAIMWADAAIAELAGGKT